MSEYHARTKKLESLCVGRRRPAHPITQRRCGKNLCAKVYRLCRTTTYEQRAIVVLKTNPDARDVAAYLAEQMDESMICTVLTKEDQDRLLTGIPPFVILVTSADFGLAMCEAFWDVGARATMTSDWGLALVIYDVRDLPSSSTTAIALQMWGRRSGHPESPWGMLTHKSFMLVALY